MSGLGNNANNDAVKKGAAARKDNEFLTPIDATKASERQEAQRQADRRAAEQAQNHVSSKSASKIKDIVQQGEQGGQAGKKDRKSALSPTHSGQNHSNRSNVKPKVTNTAQIATSSQRSSGRNVANAPRIGNNAPRGFNF